MELLKGGCTVFWDQLRTQMSDLCDMAPAIEQKLRQLSLALDQGSLQDVSRNLVDTPQQAGWMEQEAVHFRQLAAEWVVTVEQV